MERIARSHTYLPAGRGVKVDEWQGKKSERRTNVLVVHACMCASLWLWNAATGQQYMWTNRKRRRKGTCYMWIVTFAYARRACVCAGSIGEIASTQISTNSIGAVKLHLCSKAFLISVVYDDFSLDQLRFALSFLWIPVWRHIFLSLALSAFFGVCLYCLTTRSPFLPVFFSTPEQNSFLYFRYF